MNQKILLQELRVQHWEKNGRVAEELASLSESDLQREWFLQNAGMV